MATIIKSIGSAPGRDYPDVNSWIASIPNDVIASGNSYIGDVYNDSPFIIDYANDTVPAFQFGAKNGNAQFNITMRAAPGQSYRDHPNFLTNRYAFNPAVGASFQINNNYAIALGPCPYLAVIGLQFRATSAGGSRFVDDQWGGNLFLFDNIMEFGGADNIGCCRVGTNSIVAYNLIVQRNNDPRTGPFTAHFGGSIVFNNTFVLTKERIAGAPALFSMRSNFGKSTFVNNAQFGFPGEAPGTDFSDDGHNATDAAMIAGTIGNKVNLVYDDQFVNPMGLSENADFRLKLGSPLLEAGTAFSSSMRPQTVRGAAPDIGAWEAPPFPATKLVITGASQGTANYTTNLRISTDSVLAAGQSQNVTLTDPSGGSFNPSDFTLTDVTGFVFSVYTPPVDAVGVQALTAHGVGTPVITDAVFNYTTIAPVPATAVTITKVEPDVVKGQPITITVSTDHPMRVGDSEQVTLTSDLAGTFNVNPVPLTHTTLSVDVVFTPSVVGTATITGSAVGTPAIANGTLAILSKPIPPTFGSGTNIYEVGIGHQFTNLAAFATYIANKDLVANSAKAIVYVYSSENPKGFSIVPLTSNDVYGISILPAVGLGYLSVATSNIYGYPNAGIELEFLGGDVILPRGVTLRDFRLRFTDDSVLYFGSNGSALMGHCLNNRILINKPGLQYSIRSGEYSASVEMINNVFIRSGSGVGVAAFLGDGSAAILSNTFSNCYLTFGAFAGSYVDVQNNVFIDAGDNPMAIVQTASNEFFTPSRFKNNYTNVAIDSANVRTASGFIVDTVKAFVANKITDLRPVQDGAIFGKGNTLAIATNDAAGRNRGQLPDAGAFQLIPGTTLPILTGTSQSVKGQIVEYNLDSTNQVLTVSATLPPATTNANGAISQGPVAGVVTPGKVKITFPNVPPGNYGDPIITAANDGGSSVATGAFGVSIVGIRSKAIASQMVAMADAVVAVGMPSLPIAAGSDASVDTTGPQVGLMSTSYRIRTAGSITLTAAASDNVGIVKVEFYRNAVKIAEDSTNPYSIVETFTNADNGTIDYTAKAFDAAGNSTLSAVASVVVSIPANGATTPTIVAVTAYKANVTYPKDYIILTFSEPMDMSEQFSIVRPGNYNFTMRNIVAGGIWLDSTHRLLWVNGYFPFNEREVLLFAYMKDNASGWRSAAGVAVESTGAIVVTNTTPTAAVTTLTETFGGMTNGQSLGGKIWNNGVTGYGGSQFTWDATYTHFTSNGAGGVVPVARPSGIFAALHQPVLIGPGNSEISDKGFAVFFKLVAGTDSPLSLVFQGRQRDDGSIFDDLPPDQGVRVKVLRNGQFIFEELWKNNLAAAMQFPVLQGPALVNGQEYCLEIGTTTVAEGRGYAARLSLATNGVRGAIQTEGLYVVNVGYRNDLRMIQIGASDPTATTFATMTRVESLMVGFGAPVIPPVTAVSGGGRVGALAGVTESLNAGVYSYAGTGQTLGQSPGGVFTSLLRDSGGVDGYVAMKMTAATADVYLGFVLNPVAHQLAPLLPVGAMAFAVHAPAIGAYYDIRVDARMRAAARNVIVTAGDIVRIRTISTDLLVDVSHDNGVTWTILYSYTNFFMEGHTLSAQLLLPSNSAVAVYQA